MGTPIRDVGTAVGESPRPIAGILLIVCAGGGFKQVLVDTGIGTLLAEWAQDHPRANSDSPSRMTPNFVLSAGHA